GLVLVGLCFQCPASCPLPLPICVCVFGCDLFCSAQSDSQHLCFRQRLFENLRMLPHAPGVQMQAIPEDSVHDDSGDEDEEDPDKRISSKDQPEGWRPEVLRPAHSQLLSFFLTVRSSDKRIACDEEFSDSEDEGEGGRRNVANFKKAKRVKTEEERDGEDKKDIKEEDKVKDEKTEAKRVKEETKST
ncbi:hypothetical protein FKM82_019771, partial [Ascaphus truei]